MKLNVFLKNQKMARVRKKLVKELGYTEGYSILRSSVSLREHQPLIELSKNYDEYGYMSQELGEELDSMFLDDDYIVGIHRTGYTSMDKKTIDNIFNEGLINNGHIMSGGIDGTQNIERTVSLCYDFTILNGQLKSSFGYKGSEGCIIVKIPKSYLGKKEGEVKPIYYKKEGIVRLLPEFIYGYVPVEKGGILGDIIHNPNYKDNHNLDNNNLLYEESVITKGRKEGISYEPNEVSLDVKYDILLKAYKETLTKYGNKQAEHALLSLINKNDVQYFTGGANRYNLSKYVCYSDILKVMCFGLDDIENKDINSIVSNFCEQVNKVENNKKMI